MVGNRFASYPPYYRHLCTAAKVQSGEITSSFAGPTEPWFTPAAALHASLRGELTMSSPSLHPSGTSGTPRPEHRALALFIGGAGDKKSYYLAGPYRNIAYAQEPFERRLAQAGLEEACHSLYLGYHEVHGAAAIERLILPAIPDKATPIYIVGHSLGA